MNYLFMNYDNIIKVLVLSLEESKTIFYHEYFKFFGAAESYLIDFIWNYWMSRVKSSTDRLTRDLV